ncbi:MAG: hypothetical protein F6K48_22440 [Okeania sp. SIO3H1]|nr:hypothetical protein [Okeania sp. SIO1I7]NEN91510.1 hypothetical protein [Okeania sp. SIO3H1]NET25759.1 hypothetical protein [Okeania sp. SIO1I7]
MQIEIRYLCINGNPCLALTSLRVVWDLGNAEVLRILWNQAIATVKE